MPGSVDWYREKVLTRIEKMVDPTQKNTIARMVFFSCQFWDNQHLLQWSGRPDLNRGPPRPKRGALAGLRYAPSGGEYNRKHG